MTIDFSVSAARKLFTPPPGFSPLSTERLYIGRMMIVGLRPHDCAEKAVFSNQLFGVRKMKN